MIGRLKKDYLHRPTKILHFYTRENSKMSSITSKHFSFFNNKPPASWVAHITRDFLTCYSCSYYSSMSLWWSSHQWCSIKKVVLKYFTKFTAKRLCPNVLFLRMLKARGLYKKELPTQVFSCWFCKIFKNTYERLLLSIKGTINCLESSVNMKVQWKERPLLSIFSEMIVKINAFSVSIKQLLRNL